MEIMKQSCFVFELSALDSRYHCFVKVAAKAHTSSWSHVRLSALVPGFCSKLHMQIGHDFRGNNFAPVSHPQNTNTFKSPDSILSWTVSIFTIDSIALKISG